MTNIHRLAEFVDCQALPVFPYRVLTEAGMAHRYDLGEVLAIVVSQLLERRTVVIMPPVNLVSDTEED